MAIFVMVKPGNMKANLGKNSSCRFDQTNEQKAWHCYGDWFKTFDLKIWCETFKSNQIMDLFNGSKLSSSDSKFPLISKNIFLLFSSISVILLLGWSFLNLQCPANDTKLYLMVRYQFSNLNLHCYYCLVNSDLCGISNVKSSQSYLIP